MPRCSLKIGARRIVLAGICLCAAGTVPYVFAGAHTSEVLLGCALVVRGLGLSGANIAVVTARAFHVAFGRAVGLTALALIPALFCRLSSLRLGTGRDVPGRDDRLVVLRLKRADCPGVQSEQAPG